MTDRELLEQIAVDIAEVKATVQRLESTQRAHGLILQNIPLQIDEVEERLNGVISSYGAGQNKIAALVNQLVARVQGIQSQVEVCRKNDESMQRQIDQIREKL